MGALETSKFTLSCEDLDTNAFFFFMFASCHSWKVVC